MKSTYWCCVVTRDGESTVGATLDSIFNQSLPPSFVVVVDDGSTDGTPALLERESARHPGLRTIHTSSRTRDIRRVPALLNLGLGLARSIQEASGPEYMMVSGDDNWLPPNYASAVVDRMDKDQRVAVASGSPTGSPLGSDWLPHGGGRFVRSAFMEGLGGKYPVAYGWETWLIYKAMEEGLLVKNYGDLRYRHLRPYNVKNLMGWGRGMYSLGFPSYFVFLRCALNLVWAQRGTQSRTGSMAMAAGYVSAKLSPGLLRPMLIDDDHLKAFVRRFCAERLMKLKW
ncbi:MAG TPA: glycosyltransferase family A protein [Nitrososphaerales archaeon]|nr:glycosyltransferase family A protein [Nitrososphaerales archaeon]